MMKSNVTAVAEEAFLASLAEIRDQQLSCTEMQIHHLQKNPADLEKFVDDYHAKLVLLGAEKRKMATLLPAVGRDRSATEEYKNARLRAEAILASLPYTEIDSIKKLIRYSVSQYEAGEALSSRGPFAGQNKAMIKKALLSSLETIKKNRANLKRGIETFGKSFDQASRESLAQDTHLIETFRNANPKIQSQIKPVACSVDAKYGKGAEYADHVILATTILGPGLAAGLTRLSATAVVSSLRGAASMGAISARSAGVFRVLSYVGGMQAGFQQIHKACTGSEISLKTQKGVGSAVSCEGNILVSQSNENCILVSTLNALGFQQAYKTVPEAFSLITKATPVPKVKIGSAVSKTKASKPIELPENFSGKNMQIEVWKLADSGDTENAERLAQHLEDKLKNSKEQWVTPVPKYDEEIEYASRPSIMTFENGLTGVWKKQGQMSNIDAEIAVYKIDQKLGLNNVPITVEREYKSERGSLQLWVKNASNDDLQEEPLNLRWFDYLINNRDRSGKNYLVVEGRTVAIDHGVAFSKMWDSFSTNIPEEIATIEKPIKAIARKSVSPSEEKLVLTRAKNELSMLLPDKAVYEKLKETPEAEWESLLKGHLKPDQMQGFLQRRKTLINEVERLRKTYGEDVFRSGPASGLVRETDELPSHQK